MSESKYLTIQEEQGSTRISEEVIAAIAVGALREVEGVSGLMNVGGPNMPSFRGSKEAHKGMRGIRLNMDGVDLTLDLYVTVRYGNPIQETAENVQRAVSSAVEAMTGCQVGAVNVHVGGITVD